MIRTTFIIMCILLGLGACKKDPPVESKPVEQRTDYTPEEFGIGRRHTPVSACNRDIDALLNEIRLCYKNSGISKKCDLLQKDNSDRIKRHKNSIRCAR